MMDKQTTPQRDHDSDARQLALVDRIIGLEAEVANLKSLNNSRAMRDQLDEIHSSTTWKVGRLVLAPLFALKRVASRTGRR